MNTKVEEKPTGAETKKAAPKKTKALTKWEDFQGELQRRENEIGSMLPPHVNKDRFMASAVAAVKQTPDLLNATDRSLFGSVTKSAQDGLLPDGREGVITLYNEKQPDNSWQKVAQWNPMTFGLRKRAREIDDILVDAQVVHENDQFVWHQGDDPKIDHTPAPLGQARGKMIGAYAIFKKDGAILHREVMDVEQIESVRAQSKSPNGLLWEKFKSEAWRKTVVRRGFKSVPCSEKLETIVKRDDDMFAFDTDAPETAPGEKPKSTMRVVTPGAGRPLPPVVGEDRTEETDTGTETDTFLLFDEVGEEMGHFSAGEFGDELSNRLKWLVGNGQDWQTFLDNNADSIDQIKEAGQADVHAAILRWRQWADEQAKAKEAESQDKPEGEEPQGGAEDEPRDGESSDQGEATDGGTKKVLLYLPDQNPAEFDSPKEYFPAIAEAVKRNPNVWWDSRNQNVLQQFIDADPDKYGKEYEKVKAAMDEPAK